MTRSFKHLSKREILEAREFVQEYVYKEYGTERGCVKKASEGMGVNYTQLSNCLSGTIKPSKAILAACGWTMPEFKSPAGNPYQLGSIFEVETDHEVYLELLSFRTKYPWYNIMEQLPAILVVPVSNAIRHIIANPDKFLKKRELTQLEKDAFENANPKRMTSEDAHFLLAKAGDDTFEPSPTNNIDDLDVMG